MIRLVRGVGMGCIVGTGIFEEVFGMFGVVR